MSAKVNIRGRVQNSTKLDIHRSSAVTQVYVDKSRHSLVALCSKGLYIYIISTGNEVKQIYSAYKELNVQ